VDAQSDVFVVGSTFSTDFPTTNVFAQLRSINSGGSDAFVTALNTNASAVLYSAYLGGSFNDVGYGIAVDLESSAYIAGGTFSTNFPTTPGALQGSLDASSDGFIAKIRLKEPLLSVEVVGENLLLKWPASAPGYVLEFTTSLAPPVDWKPVLQAPVLDQGWYIVTISAGEQAALFRLRRL
jgi:hypothetical protein